MTETAVKSLAKTLQNYPGSYCILTVASSDENWARCYIEKLLEEAETYPFHALQNLIHWLQEQGFFGKRIQEKRFQRKIIHNRLRHGFAITDRILLNKLLLNHKSPAIESWYWTFDSYKYALLSDVESLKYKYRSHIAHVKSIVASNRLLIWNVEDGPDQVCRFFNKSGKYFLLT